MIIFFKIAFRNILKNGKRTLLIGLTLVITCTVLLFSFSIGNGIRRQILDKYRDTQSGDVSVVWSNVKEIDPSDPSRLFFSTYDFKKDKENRAAIKRLDEFIHNNPEEIKSFIKCVRGSGMLDTGTFASYNLIFGVDEAELAYLQEKRAFQLTDGRLPFAGKYAIVISDDAAKSSNISIGDWVTLDSGTSTGFVNTQEYQVIGLYRSSSDFDSIYVYMTKEDALELFDQSPDYFQSVRIFLNDPDQAGQFAARLDAYLTEGGNVLRAEPISYSSEFYSRIAIMIKSLFTMFVIFILFIIGIGIRSVVRMNLFERMKEFGTLRAIGFKRFQTFLVIFLEILIMSLLFFAAAFFINAGLTAILNSGGIYIGKGAVAYALGGESIYPVFEFYDTFTALVIITLFSLFAPLKPGLRLCFHKITDLLAQNQKPLSAILEALKGLYAKKSKAKQPQITRIGD